VSSLSPTKRNAHLHAPPANLLLTGVSITFYTSSSEQIPFIPLISSSLHESVPSSISWYDFFCHIFGCASCTFRRCRVEMRYPTFQQTQSLIHASLYPSLCYFPTITALHDLSKTLLPLTHAAAPYQTYTRSVYTLSGQLPLPGLS
jgi:hypothetical protein